MTVAKAGYIHTHTHTRAHSVSQCDGALGSQGCAEDASRDRTPAARRAALVGRDLPHLLDNHSRAVGVEEGHVVGAALLNDLVLTIHPRLGSLLFHPAAAQRALQRPAALRRRAARDCRALAADHRLFAEGPTAWAAFRHTTRRLWSQSGLGQNGYGLCALYRSKSSEDETQSNRDERRRRSRRLTAGDGVSN